MTSSLLTSIQVKTLLALIRVYERDGRATVRSVAEERGRSAASTHFVLKALVWKGFADTRGKGALRPLVRSVPFG